MRILLLGGTQDASQLAQLLAEAGQDAVFSYAGRTQNPSPQPLPMRFGGFGGVDGLRAYLEAEKITHLVDATHPFAAQMSRNAVAACAKAGVALCALERPPWTPGVGDDWRFVPDIDAAVNALPETPARVFLAIGRQNIGAFGARPQHFYLLRYIDPPEEIDLPDYVGIAGRGPFTQAGDAALMRAHGITLVVAKNAGGAAARAKLQAARALSLPVIMIERPEIPARQRWEAPADVLRWLAHDASSAGAERGV